MSVSLSMLSALLMSLFHPRCLHVCLLVSSSAFLMSSFQVMCFQPAFLMSFLPLCVCVCGGGGGGGGVSIPRDVSASSSVCAL